jgi:hypothetical protein
MQLYIRRLAEGIESRLGKLGKRNERIGKRIGDSPANNHFHIRHCGSFWFLLVGRQNPPPHGFERLVGSACGLVADHVADPSDMPLASIRGQTRR